MLRQYQVRTTDGREWTVWTCPCRGDQYPYFTKPQKAHFRTQVHQLWAIQASTPAAMGQTAQ
jgi:hypothetical protein